MATVPHTLASCEPLTTLIAACFGDQPTPAPQPSADRSTAETHWQDAVTQVGEQLRVKLRVEALPERLHKALALVLAHAVTLDSDGTASVQSGKQTYRLAPDCSCADAAHRAELCKHRLAVELHHRALALLDSTALAPASSPTAVAAEAPAGATPPPSA
ncbi:MAG TPA: SWIM zinc finger family protein, partial [Candidatus Saccharimonadia bacterium]|nr:SWIM zinc finger family protein [Candidatus Saccharimonadia bacterium]